jgi:hypothetical protein
VTADGSLAAHWTVGQVTISLGRTLGFAVAVWLAIFASRITQVLLRDDVLPRFALPRGVPNAISTVANYAMVLVGLLIGAGILGIELSNLTLIVGALGVSIGFGLRRRQQSRVGFSSSSSSARCRSATPFRSPTCKAGSRDRSARQPVRVQRIRSGRAERRAISNRLINWTLSIGVAGSRSRWALPRRRSRSGPFDSSGVLARERVMRDRNRSSYWNRSANALHFRLYFWIRISTSSQGDRPHQHMISSPRRGRHRVPFLARHASTARRKACERARRF